MNYNERIEELGLKKKWIANKMGISKTLLSFYLTGTRPIPKNKKAELEKILG